MNIEVQRAFLSSENIGFHLDYLRNMRLKYSIYKKSIPALEGKTLRQLSRMLDRCDDKHDIISLACCIKSHELFFSSFSDNSAKCPEIREWYSSESAFLYEVYQKALGQRGFIYITRVERRSPEIVLGSDEKVPQLVAPPLLAIDLCEHAYFLDYHFDREAYIRALLTHLDLRMLFRSENAEIYLDTTI